MVKEFSHHLDSEALETFFETGRRSARLVRHLVSCPECVERLQSERILRVLLPSLGRDVRFDESMSGESPEGPRAAEGRRLRFRLAYGPPPEFAQPAPAPPCGRAERRDRKSEDEEFEPVRPKRAEPDIASCRRRDLAGPDHLDPALIEGLLTEALAPAAAARLERHLASCDPCLIRTLSTLMVTAVKSERDPELLAVPAETARRMRLSFASGLEARRIGRLLGWQPGGGAPWILRWLPGGPPLREGDICHAPPLQPSVSEGPSFMRRGRKASPPVRPDSSSPPNDGPEEAELLEESYGAPEDQEEAELLEESCEAPEGQLGTGDRSPDDRPRIELQRIEPPSIRPATVIEAPPWSIEVSVWSPDWPSAQVVMAGRIRAGEGARLPRRWRVRAEESGPWTPVTGESFALVLPARRCVVEFAPPLGLSISVELEGPEDPAP